VDADEVTEDDLAEEPARKAPPAMPDAAQRPRSVTPMMTPAVIMPATAPLQPPPPPQAPGASTQAPPEELRPRRRRRVKQWFEEIFDDDYLRTLPYLSARQTERESAFTAESLGLEPGAAVLDVGCGYGRHAMDLAGRGFQVTGIDLSLPLLIRAADAARRIGVAVNFVHGDMREMTFDQEFDGAYCLFTSFGYFDDDTNRKVAANLQRALKPGGRVLIELVNRDYITKDLPTRVWWQGEGCVVLEEVDFNYFSSRLQVQRSIIFEDGRQLEQEISIRAYSLHEIGKVLHHAGFRVIEVSGGLGLRGNFFGALSRQLIVLAEKKVG
jgi:SAM-dependent methyltransferase